MGEAKREGGQPSLRAAALVLLGVTLVAFAPFLYHTVRCGGSCWGVHDWAQFAAWYDLPRMALLQYGQLAFWNPYVSGGVPGFGHTHDATFSPVFLVVLVFGAVTGTRVLAVGWTYLAMLSMFGLARFLRLRRLGCYLAAIVWGLNGHYTLHFLVGHIQHLPVGLLPLAVLLFMRERADRANLFLAALLVGGFVLAGGVYPAAYAGLLLGVLAAVLAILQRSARWLVRLAWIGVYAGFFAAVKLVATVPYLLNIAPTPPDVSGTGIGFLCRRLISPEPPWTIRTMGSSTLGFWEFGAYVGVAVVALSGVGVVVAAWGLARGRVGQGKRYQVPFAGTARGVLRTKGTWYLFQNPDPRWGALLAAAAVFLLLSFGSKGPVDLFGLLRRVPVFGALHVPFRFVIVPLMCVALAAGMGLDWVARRGRIARVAGVVLIVAAAGDLVWAYRHLVPSAFAIDEIDIDKGTAVASDRGQLPGYAGARGPMTVAGVGPRGKALFEQRRLVFDAATLHLSGRDFHVIEPHSAARYLMQLQHRGNVEGYEMLRLESAVRWVGQLDYRSEAHLERSPGWARLVDFSPSRFTVEVNATAADVLFLNQNVTAGWRVTIDGRTSRVSTTRKPGLVSAEVPAGHRRVVFWYRPVGFWWGLAVSVGSLAAVPIRIILSRRWLRRGRAGA